MIAAIAEILTIHQMMVETVVTLAIQVTVVMAVIVEEEIAASRLLLNRSLRIFMIGF